MVFSGVVAGSTVVYAFLTWRLVSETRRMREVQTEPRVSVRIEQNHTGQSGYELVVRNEGQGPAKNVRFVFKGDASYFRRSFLRNAPPTVDQLPVIKDGLDYMETGQTFRFTLGIVSREEFDRAAQAPWTFCTKYENLYGRTKEDIYVVDFSQFRGGIFDTNWPEKISKHLDFIQRDLHRLTEGYAKVQVVTQTREEFEQRCEEWRKAQSSHIANSPEMPIIDNNNE